MADGGARGTAEGALAKHPALILAAALLSFRLSVRVLLAGAIGILLGLAMWGHKLIKTVGPGSAGLDQMRASREASLSRNFSHDHAL